MTVRETSTAQHYADLARAEWQRSTGRARLAAWRALRQAEDALLRESRQAEDALLRESRGNRPVLPGDTMEIR